MNIPILSTRYAMRYSCLPTQRKTASSQLGGIPDNYITTGAAYEENIAKMMRGESKIRVDYEGETFYFALKFDQNATQTTFTQQDARAFAEKYDFDNMSTADYLRFYSELSEFGAINGFEAMGISASLTLPNEMSRMSHSIYFNNPRGLNGLIEHYQKIYDSELRAKLDPRFLNFGEIYSDTTHARKMVDILNMIKRAALQ